MVWHYHDDDVAGPDAEVTLNLTGLGHVSGAARVTSYCSQLASAATAQWDHDRRRTAGIRPGMPLAEATALAGYTQSAPQNTSRAASRAKIKKPPIQSDPASSAAPLPLHLEMADPAADHLALEALAEWCRQFSPTVGLEEAAEPESLLLNTSGLGPLCGGEPALARRVVDALHERGLTARVAIADTLAGAWALAHFTPLEMAGETDDLKAILSALRAPVIVPAGETSRAIAPLGVEALRLPESIREMLIALGLRRIEQVAALPRATLLARFGPLVLERLDRAAGRAAEAIVARKAPEELDFERPFEHPTDRREMIERALDELTARACDTLARERRGGLRLQCRFEHERQPASGFVVGLYRPSASPRHVSELVRLKFESLRFREPVAGIRLRVLAADRLVFRQQEILFPESVRGHRPTAPRELAGLIDRLSNRLGRRAVLRPWLMAGAQPEFACQFQPLAGLASARPNSARKGPPAAMRPTGDRPLHLEPRPRPLPVVSIAPEGPPVQFRLAGRDERIVRAWGPERIETGWWRTRYVRRDYYQVETARGARLWLFRQLNSGAWFLHGEFT